MIKKVCFLFVLMPLVVSCSMAAKHTGEAKDSVPVSALMYSDPVTEMEFVFVKGGCFDMGDVFGDGVSDEKPVHQTCVNDFYMGKYPVTQDQWKKVTGKDGSQFTTCGGNCPEDKVSWYDAMQYITLLNRLSGKTYRLPTEAEWEYAARSGGKKEKWAGTSNQAELSDYAWYASNSGQQTHPVGGKRPNELGLYDMTGNVWNWVWDFYDGNYYSTNQKDNPRGPASALFGHRVLKGGCWNSEPADARVFRRFNHGPDRQDPDMGFRLVMVP